MPSNICLVVPWLQFHAALMRQCNRGGSTHAADKTILGRFEKGILILVCDPQLCHFTQRRSIPGFNDLPALIQDGDPDNISALGVWAGIDLDGHAQISHMVSTDLLSARE
jgi:hypothetical protein